LKRARVSDKKYFVGSPYVQMDYAKQYPEKEAPKTWFIDKVIRQSGLQSRQPKKRRPGGSEYLLYPVQAIRNLGHVHQSADFIGKKYIAGQREPINIFSTSYYSPFKLYQIAPVAAEKAVNAIDQLSVMWRQYPIPDVLRMDNGLQFRGTAHGQRNVGTFLKFLLNLGVIPLFGSPSKPWTNPHVEGHNRVFNEKVWGTNYFTSRVHVAAECHRFNQESLEYFHFKYAPLLFNSPFRYIDRDQPIEHECLSSVQNKKIYFIRFVESLDKSKEAFITVLNAPVPISERYNHQFVFVEWDIEKESLRIYSEYKKVVTLISEMKFSLNIA